MINVKEMLIAVRSLGMPTNQFAVSGSSVLLMHGIVDSVRDIDVVAFGTAWETVRNVGISRRAPHGDDMISFRDGMIEVFNGWSNMDWRIQDLIAQADYIDGLRFITLDKVLAYKKRFNRPQDQEHITLIEAHLAERKSKRDARSVDDVELKKSA